VDGLYTCDASKSDQLHPQPHEEVLPEQPRPFPPQNVERRSSQITQSQVLLFPLHPHPEPLPLIRKINKRIHAQLFPEELLQPQLFAKRSLITNASKNYL